MILSNKRVSRSNFGTLCILLILALLGVVMMVPLVYALLQSLKPMEEIFVFPPRFWVSRPSLENFSGLFRVASELWVPFSRYAFNSIFIAVVCTTIQLLFASLAAYPLAKQRFRGRDTLFNIVVISLMFTGDVLGLPHFMLVSALGITDTYWAMIIPTMAYPMGLFLMRQNMLTLPDALLEAARIDGAPERVVFWEIVMPNMKSAFMTMVVFSFGAMWGRADGTYIYSEQLKGLPTMITQISSAGIARAGVAAAATVLMMIPPILVFIISQSQIIEAMTNSGIKE